MTTDTPVLKRYKLDEIACETCGSKEGFMIYCRELTVANWSPTGEWGDTDFCDDIHPVEGSCLTCKEPMSEKLLKAIVYGYYSATGKK